MSTNVSLIGKLLRKDVRLFWPFAALTALLFALSQVPPFLDLLGRSAAGLWGIGSQFAFVLLILVVFYEDAVVSLKHDWLTRPVPGPTLLAAKVLFIVGAIVVPSILGAFAYNLMEGRSFVEALVAGIASGASGGTVFGILVVMAFASVTAGIRQAIIVLLSVVAVLALGTGLFNTMFQEADPMGVTPAAWMLERTHQIVFTVAAVAVLWVQYRHRHTRSARVIAGVAVASAVLVLVTIDWPRASFIQQAMAAEPDAPESRETLTLPAGCFPLRRFDRRIDVVPNEDIDVEARKEENQRPVTFRTRLAGADDTPERRLVVDHASITWSAAGVREKHLPLSFMADRKLASAASPAAERQWVLSFADFQRLSAIPGIETHVDYSLSVLAATTSAELVANGERRYHAGLGWCDATVDRSLGNVDVSCFLPGVQPARLVARLAGVPESAAVASHPRLDYTPAVLDFWGGDRHRMSLKYAGGDVPRVTVTAYEPRAHFDRHFVVPGVLGGPASACPAP